jgi:hypothetical protein
LILEDNTRYTSLQRAAPGAYSRTNSAACFDTVVAAVFVVASDGCQSVQLVLMVLPLLPFWVGKEGAPSSIVIHMYTAPDLFRTHLIDTLLDPLLNSTVQPQ